MGLSQGAGEKDNRAQTKVIALKVVGSLRLDTCNYF